DFAYGRGAFAKSVLTDLRVAHEPRNECHVASRETGAPTSVWAKLEEWLQSGAARTASGGGAPARIGSLVPLPALADTDTEFYRHSFDYFSPDIDPHYGFGTPVVWGQVSGDGLERTDDNSDGENTFGGVGVSVTGCDPHIGKGGG